jgi:LPS O-antigen subunit length determinant protein (WzzB/FepE family)
MNTSNDHTKLDSPIDLEISLLELYSIISKKKVLIILITLSFSLSSIYYSFSLDKYYSASLLMMPAASSSQSSQGLSSLLTGLTSGPSIFGSAPKTKEALAIFQSRLFIESFITREDLMPKLFYQSFDEEDLSWISDEIPSLKDGYEQILSSLKIDLDGSLITISLTSYDPDLAADIVNLMTKAVNNHIREESIEESKRSISFLEAEINKTNLSGSIQMLYRLIEQQTQAIMVANTRSDYAFKVIDPAVAPVHPAGPNRRIIVIISTFIGFIGSLFIVLVVNFFNNNRN